jgi:hypothetical protein
VIRVLAVPLSVRVFWEPITLRNSTDLHAKRQNYYNERARARGREEKKENTGTEYFSPSKLS